MKSYFKNSLVFLSILFFSTACLDEALESLCEELGQNSSIGITMISIPTSENIGNKEYEITVFDPDSNSLSFDSCDGDFTLPFGEIDVQTGATDTLTLAKFLLTSEEKNFFLDSSEAPLNQQLRAQVRVKDDCSGTNLATIGDSSLADPLWNEATFESESCNLTTHGAIIPVSFIP